MTFVSCLHCSTSFDKKPAEIRKTSNHFCSKSCSATFNNKKSPKRKLSNSCRRCRELIRSDRTFCKKCLVFRATWSTATLKEVQSGAKYQVNARIRSLARAEYKRANRPRKCYECGYDKQFDVCHIKAISEFSSESYISEINAPDNLIALCKTHHWELDHGYLVLAA
jgi:hypothetical protein